jgi:hypothetical protein
MNANAKNARVNAYTSAHALWRSRLHCARMSFVARLRVRARAHADDR